MPLSQKDKKRFSGLAGQKTYIDCFSGCGGLSLGLGYAGWNGLFALEKDPMAYATFKHNFVDDGAPYQHFKMWPDWISKEAHAIEEILDNPQTAKHLDGLRGKVTLVAGGPPCQGFSVAGARNGNDPRNLLVFKQIELIRKLKPMICIVENVGGFAKKFISRPIDGMSVNIADAAMGEIEGIGYDVGKVTVNAADYGVPQLRERVIILGILKEFSGGISRVNALLTDCMKQVSLTQRERLKLPANRYVNIAEAISDLSGEDFVLDPEFPKYKTVRYLAPQSEYQKLMRAHTAGREIPNCHRLNNHSEKAVRLYKKALATQAPGRLSKEFLYENGCHSNKRFVLDVSKPSSTLTTAPEEFIHYRHPRVVTLREMARLQSFPDDFEFLGRYTLNGPARGVDVPRNAQIGNAVPPLVGMALGMAVNEIITMALDGDARLASYR